MMKIENSPPKLIITEIEENNMRASKAKVTQDEQLEQSVSKASLKSNGKSSLQTPKESLANDVAVTPFFNQDTLQVPLVEQNVSEFNDGSSKSKHDKSPSKQKLSQSQSKSQNEGKSSPMLTEESELKVQS